MRSRVPWQKSDGNRCRCYGPKRTAGHLRKSKFDPPCPFEVLGIEKRDASEFRDDAYGRALQDAKAVPIGCRVHGFGIARLSNTEQYFLGRERKLCRRIPDNRASWKQMRLLYVWIQAQELSVSKKRQPAGLWHVLKTWMGSTVGGWCERYFLADYRQDVVPQWSENKATGRVFLGNGT